MPLGHFFIEILTNFFFTLKILAIKKICAWLRQKSAETAMVALAPGVDFINPFTSMQSSYALRCTYMPQKASQKYGGKPKMMRRPNFFFLKSTPWSPNQSEQALNSYLTCNNSEKSKKEDWSDKTTHVQRPTKCVDILYKRFTSKNNNTTQ